VLPAIDSLIAAPGDGTSPSSPRKILFFVSDGVADANTAACSQPTTPGQDPQTGQKYTRCQEPLNVSWCTAMKARGVKIAVLYTTYLALPTNGWYLDRSVQQRALRAVDQQPHRQKHGELRLAGFLF
jgi:hypothetical protein